jgi:hypothetical protein
VIFSNTESVNGTRYTPNTVEGIEKCVTSGFFYLYVIIGFRCFNVVSVQALGIRKHSKHKV